MLGDYIRGWITWLVEHSVAPKRHLPRPLRFPPRGKGSLVLIVPIHWEFKVTHPPARDEVIKSGGSRGVCCLYCFKSMKHHRL